MYYQVKNFSDNSHKYPQGDQSFRDVPQSWGTTGRTPKHITLPGCLLISLTAIPEVEVSSFRESTSGMGIITFCTCPRDESVNSWFNNQTCDLDLLRSSVDQPECDESVKNQFIHQTYDPDLLKVQRAPTCCDSHQWIVHMV